MRAIGRKHRAITRIEQRIVFHRNDSSLHRIHRAAALAQHGSACFQRRVETRCIGGFFFGRHVLAQDHACAAMDREMPFRGRDRLRYNRSCTRRQEQSSARHDRQGFQCHRRLQFSEGRMD